MSNKELSPEMKIKKEKNRLTRICKVLDDDTKALAIGLIDEAAFLKVQMDIEKDLINQEGVMIKYQNGENQWGYKKSPHVDAYNTFNKQYTTIMKQIISLLPKEMGKGVNELSEFAKRYA